jgi:hypothetical protein
MGVTLALPLLDAMAPVATPWQKTAAAAATRTRLSCIEMVHGSAGSTTLGISRNMWAPAAEGHAFDLAPTSMASLEPYRDYLTIVSNIDVVPAEAREAREVGGDHFRSSATFLTQAHPKQTEGSDVLAGTSMDQLYANRFGEDTPIPSMQLAIENVDQAGGCAYGYACVYTDTISWAAPNQPLPMVRDPRVAFDQLFGAGATPAERAARLQTDRSILDWITQEATKLRKELGPSDRQRLSNYLDDVREIERRIQRIEARNASGDVRELPEAPIGVPDSFEDHVKLMFDLQALAFAADVTRVFSLKLGRDGSGRVYPGSGVTTGFHGASHHGESEARIVAFEKINRYHVSLVPYFLEKLKNTPDGDGSLLDHTLIVYGSPMGDSNLHNHKKCPLFLAGHASGQLKGNLHVRAADNTPMANVFLTLQRRLGLTDMKSFGDSNGEIAI